jgi:hypothetical protein
LLFSCELSFEDRAAARVFVPQIDVDLADPDRPRRDQHAFEEAVRVALEVLAVLEGAGSPSSMLTAIRRGSGSAATIFHLRPIGKPAPPRPRSAESSMILVISSRVRLPARQSAISL